MDPQLHEAGLSLQVEGPIARITLDRPERRNAMTPGMWRGLAHIGHTLSPDVRIVVIEGSGPSFSAGLDLSLLGSGEGQALTAIAADEPASARERMESFIAECQEGFLWLRRPDIVTVAAVHGHAVGAGFQLALACDLRILADDARLTMKESALGLVPDLTGTKPLVDLVGPNRALELCLTARTVDAAEARELRLAELVVQAAELRGATDDLCHALLATPREVASALKRLVHGAGTRGLAEQAAAERGEQAPLMLGLLGG
jgi:enoyl-CoA hydratase/carnithine racemase